MISLSSKGFVTVVLHTILKKLKRAPVASLEQDVEALLQGTIEEPKKEKASRANPPIPYTLLLQKTHVGVLYEKNVLSAATVVAKPHAVVIENLSALAYAEGDVKPFDSIKEQNPKDEKRIENAVITAAFPTLKTLARTIEVEPVKKEMLDAIIQYQIEPLLPYEIASCVFDKIELKKESEKKDQFLIFSAKKEDLQSHIEAYRSLGIDPEIICPKALGQANFAKLFFNDDTMRLFIDISAEETTCLLFQNGTPLAIRSLPMTLEPQASTIETHLENYARELSRILVGFQNNNSEVKSCPLVFTGTQERDPIILSFLGKLLGYGTEVIQTIPAHVQLSQNVSKDDLAAFAIPIGLALILSPFQNEQAVRSLSINLRKEEFSYTRKWRRWKKDLIVYFSLMLLLSFSLFYIGNASLNDKSHEVQQKYLSLVSLLDKTEDEIETAFAKKMGFEKRLLNKDTPLTLKELEERFSFIEGAFLKRSYEEIALHPNIARVSDLLAWLTSHPKVTTPAPISIESLSYTMLKRPDKEKLKEHYVIKVDLDFTAPTGERAREFYDSLCAPNPFVDPKEEVKWSVQRGRYQTSFFLKDRTQYP